MGYLYEIVPKEKRATIYGLIKGISTLGVVLIPVLRDAVMGADTTLWRGVYLLPAVIAIGVSVFTFAVTRESKTFLDRRIAYLESPYEDRHPEKKKLSPEEKRTQKAASKQQKSGVFHALGHLFKNKQLLLKVRETKKGAGGYGRPISVAVCDTPDGKYKY